MPAQLQKGYVFADGGTVNAATLNNLVDLGTALPGIISEQPLVTAVPTDQVILLKAGALKRANVSTLPTGVTSISMTRNPASVFSSPGPTITTTGTFAISLNNQQAVTTTNRKQNKILASPADGSLDVPTFRTIVPKDTAALIDIAALVFDFTLGHAFRKVLYGAGIHHLKINNGIPGQVVTIFVTQGDVGGPSTVDWATDDPIPAVVRWSNSGTQHTMTTGAISAMDIVTFRCTDFGQYYGTFDKDFTP